MAALALSVGGAAAGGSVFGPAGAIVGRLIGAVGGNVIDQYLFGAHQERQVEGPRLADLEVMASTVGAPIPRIYGRARLSGQLIWATNLEEVISTSSDTTGGKAMGGGSKVTTDTTTYSYFANIAIGLCEGPISAVLRVWADGQLLDLSNLTYRIYLGGEEQSADPLIVAKEGDVPAYRGLAYVVFERLPLDVFGNRIPQLSFEIVRAIGTLEQMVRAVTLSPGATEFGYEPDTVVQVTGPGQSAPENRHVSNASSDIMASLDELQGIAPNLERVAVVVAWFGTDLRAGQCRVMPGVDNSVKATNGSTWAVAGVLRDTAYVVSTIGGRAAYGGTPSDNSVEHLIAKLKGRGLKVTLYPFLMMDIPSGNALPDPWTGAASQPVYPWRGRITCDPAPGQAGSPDSTAAAADQVNAFFTGGADSWNYRTMVLNCAQIAASAGGVDAFLIGSELKSLIRVRSAPGVYPAVAALASLAAEVKALLGPATLVTYGADWTEYGAHVVSTSEIRFPLDTLWASPSIDAVGIDYYAPLADWRDDAGQLDRSLTDSPYDVDYLSGNLKRGESYDWYYANDAARDAQTRTPITDSLGKPWVFRQKDIWNFWSQPHYERVAGVELGTPTAWVPQSKPVWITEIGCPAVDKGANQPSVFPDANSSEAGLPYYSDGKRDDLMQRRMLEAMLGAFDPSWDGALNATSTVYGGAMVPPDCIHLWTWDARPFPVFPAATNVWSDGPNWETGHWLTGRLGSAPLDALVGTILSDNGVTDTEVSGLVEGPDGYVVDRPMAPRGMLDPLALAFSFDAFEEGDTLRFRQRGGVPACEIGEDDLILPDGTASAQMVRVQEGDLPRQVSIGFTDIGADYQRSAVTSRRLVGASSRTSHADLAMVTNNSEAERRANIWLQDLWAGREGAQFALPPSRVALALGDIVGLTVNGRRRLVEIQEIMDTESRAIRGCSIDPEVFNLLLAPSTHRVPVAPPALAPVHAAVLDLPALTPQQPTPLARLAIFADPWPGPVAVWTSGDGATYSRTATALAPAVIGVTLDDLPAGPTGRWHPTSFRVQLYGGALASVSDGVLFAGANTAAVQRAHGAWEVLQFAGAELIGAKTYRLSRLLRGQGGSEWAMASVLPVGSPFVLLDRNIVNLASGSDALERELQVRVVAANRDHGDASALALTATPLATALMPLVPVHLAARRDGTGVTFNWIRRARYDADSWAGEIPLAEDSEQYAVDIMSGSSAIRTLTTPTVNVLYPAASELADFGTAQESLSIQVAQVSATVGRGIAASAILIP